MLRKLLLTGMLRQGIKFFPGVLSFLKRWWLALLLAGLVIGGLFAWLAISLLLWAWNVLPDIMGYFVNHFAPAFEIRPEIQPALPSAESI